MPLIEAARNGQYGDTLVACLTDSILGDHATREDSRLDQAANILDRHFDLAIVRSDPVFARLEEFFQPENALQTPLYHVGFVKMFRNGSSNLSGYPANGILVSADNDASSVALYKRAITAYRTLKKSLKIPMAISPKTRLQSRDMKSLLSLGDGLPGLTLLDHCTDLDSAWTKARWSISQCGYDTAVDVIRTETPTLFVPSTDKNIDEQIERAKRLVYWGAGRLLMPHHLNTASLVNEIHQLTKFEPRRMSFDLNGASNAAELIAQIVYKNDYSFVISRPSSGKRLH